MHFEVASVSNRCYIIFCCPDFTLGLRTTTEGRHGGVYSVLDFVLNAPILGDIWGALFNSIFE